MIILAILLLIVIGVILFLQHPQFGKSPTGARLERIRQSPNYKNGQFQNLKHTPQLTEGYSIIGVIFQFLFNSKAERRPKGKMPTRKISLQTIPLNENVLVWFGHSSYYFQLDGKRFLVDPVLSGSASPLPGSNKAFIGTDIYTADELPPIDVLVITHDHYDHIDYTTLRKLQPRVSHVVTGLGVGAHLERWGYPPGIIKELDWHESVEMIPGFTFHSIPTRHFSGRTFLRNQTLWSAFLLEAPSMKIFIGGDSGYDDYYAKVGAEYGPIDLAILDNGQYDPRWKYIHFHPSEVLQAARDLQAKRLMPVHSGKFIMANHPWDEPLATIWELNEPFPIPLVTPRIGEIVELTNERQHFDPWWEDVV